MFSNSQHQTSAGKAFLESQLSAFNALAGIAMRAEEKIVALNIATVKESTDDTMHAVQDMLAVKDQQAFLSLPCRMMCQVRMDNDGWNRPQHRSLPLRRHSQGVL